MTAFPVAIIGQDYPGMREAITRNGGAVVGDPAAARGLVASFGADKGELREVLDTALGY